MVDTRESASSILIQFLATSHEDSDKEFVALCGQYPAHASELTRLYRLQRQIQEDLAVFGQARDQASPAQRPGHAQPGDVIGDFELVSRIASGGQGEVWEAQQRSLARRVALKLVLPSRINEKSLALFAREARAGGRLAHPGIVAVYGHGEDAGRHWISQELVPGAWTLRDFIDEVRDAPELPSNYYRAVAIFVAEIAEALQAAHDAGVIHRDIKPQNIMVTPQDHPKITDFGLARILSDAEETLSGAVGGTWLYMSPEQVTSNRRELDHRTDIFSLGVLMYEMLALKRPFDGDTSHQVVENILHMDPLDLSSIRSRVPTDLTVICTKALEKSPTDRYPSMTELAGDLRRHLVHESIHARSPSVLERSWKWMRRNPAKGVAGVLVTLASLILGGLSLRLANSNRALAAMTEEAQFKAEEAQRKTSDILRLSLSQDVEDLIREVQDLWPVHPSKVESLRSWTRKAEELGKELPGLRRRRQEFRQSAIPQTESEQWAGRESHPDIGELRAVQRELNAKRNARAVREGQAHPEPVTIVEADYPTHVPQLNSAAWEMVKPGRTSFGEEALGLAIAQRALGLATEGQRSGVLNTVAWANIALGLDDPGLDASAEALEEAPESLKDKLQEKLMIVEAAVDLATSAEGRQQAALEIEQLVQRSRELEQRVGERHTWTFTDEQEQENRARWWHNTLSALIDRIESLSEAGRGLLLPGAVSREHGWSIARRLKSAEELQRAFETGGEYRLRWEEALPAIHSSYPGVELAIQAGLVPLGLNPDTGLWEFWHVLSGAIPERNAAGGLEILETTGCVFVLIPGGTFQMGFQRNDPAGDSYDPWATGNNNSVHEVRLSPYFISKYELTQGQWLVMTGDNPSHWHPEYEFIRDRSHPVENVSWTQVMELLPRFSMWLPTEAQWENAARGGTRTTWWTGNSRESLLGVANIADLAAREQGATWESLRDWPKYRDGFPLHGPVSVLRANPFGLHGLHGNVEELCRDAYEVDAYLRLDQVDPWRVSSTTGDVVVRDGSFDDVARDATVGLRHSLKPHQMLMQVGLRPVIELTSSGTNP